MKVLLRLTVSFLLWSWAATAVRSTEFTNRVPLMDGVSVILANGRGEPLGTDGPDVFANEQTYLLMENSGTNKSYVIFLGKLACDIKLLSEEGVEVPKTSLGKAMSKGPKSLTDIDANFTVVGAGHPGILLQPGAERLIEFAKPGELFSTAANRRYTLEVRYWTWDKAKKRFVLSGPLRVKVSGNKKRIGREGG